jgi:hypothetical protein
VGAVETGGDGALDVDLPRRDERRAHQARRPQLEAGDRGRAFGQVAGERWVVVGVGLGSGGAARGRGRARAPVATPDPPSRALDRPPFPLPPLTASRPWSTSVYRRPGGRGGCGARGRRARPVVESGGEEGRGGGGAAARPDAPAAAGSGEPPPPPMRASYRDKRMERAGRPVEPHPTPRCPPSRGLAGSRIAHSFSSLSLLTTA